MEHIWPLRASSAPKTERTVPTAVAHNSTRFHKNCLTTFRGRVNSDKGKDICKCKSLIAS